MCFYTRNVEPIYTPSHLILLDCAHIGILLNFICVRYCGRQPTTLLPDLLNMSGKIWKKLSKLLNLNFLSKPYIFVWQLLSPAVKNGTVSETWSDLISHCFKNDSEILSIAWILIYISIISLLRGPYNCSLHVLDGGVNFDFTMIIQLAFN